jgi:hypothetical protein
MSSTVPACSTAAGPAWSCRSGHVTWAPSSRRARDVVTLLDVAPKSEEKDD